MCAGCEGSLRRLKLERPPKSDALIRFRCGFLMLPRQTLVDVERTKFDVLVLETPESLFKSNDVGMERGIKRHVAGWELSRNSATVGVDQKTRHIDVEGLTEIYRWAPGH